MLRATIAAAIVLASGAAVAGDAAKTPNQQPPDGSYYVQIIVTACPQPKVLLQPTNQGHSYDDDPEYTTATHEAEMKKLHCRDVPIPPQVIRGNTQMTMSNCQEHAGFVTAMEFLQGRPDLAGFQAVGGWQCILEHSRPKSITDM
jgi:hypothetical protein